LRVVADSRAVDPPLVTGDRRIQNSRLLKTVW
jgi:hypothetical protein